MQGLLSARLKSCPVTKWGPKQAVMEISAAQYAKQVPDPTRLGIAKRLSPFGLWSQCQILHFALDTISAKRETGYVAVQQKMQHGFLDARSRSCRIPASQARRRTAPPPPPSPKSTMSLLITPPPP